EHPLGGKDGRCHQGAQPGAWVDRGGFERNSSPVMGIVGKIGDSGENGRRLPTLVELAAHDGESTTPRKAQHKLGRAMN
ncbi:unnamed protein product, partial [Scytosiphon promiscuus]